MDRTPVDTFHLDVVVVGAGPTGLACGIDAKRAGFSVANIDKGCLVNSLFNYPSNMTFFTTPELLEIGDIPFSSPNQKPTRQRGARVLPQGRRVLQARRAPVRAGARDRGQRRALRRPHYDRSEAPRIQHARKLAMATGYYDLPNYEDPRRGAPKVQHYYDEPHPYFGLDVLVMGGKNSAAIAALELWRHGARVTLVHRDPEIHRHVKYWIKPDIENRIKNGQIQAYFRRPSREITPEHVKLETQEGEVTLKNDYVFALTGYHPDFEFLERSA